jgi:enediyne biosynthesis protein E4
MGWLSRRRRGLAYAGVAAGLIIVALVIFVTGDRDGASAYRPGEGAEGLTSNLARAVPDDAPTLLFSDVAATAGIDFQHFPGVRTGVITEDMGSGAAWGDYDADGDPDLYLVNWVREIPDDSVAAEGQPGNRLFRNEADGSFSDVSSESGLDWSGPGSAAAWGDLDGDGRLDLWTTSLGRNRLYRNLGDGRFEEVSGAAGISGHEGFWTGVSLGDYDRDGDLDVYVSGYVRYDPRVATGYSRQYEVEQPASLNPSSFEPQANLFFRNDGRGRFEEVAQEAGLDNASGRSLSAAWADFDRDGWLDLYVANDVSDNALFRNRGDGTFENVSLQTGVADYRGAMGLAVSDWNADGDLDLFITHWVAQENALFENLLVHTAPHDYGMRFMDVADRRGLGQSSLDYVGWATGFADFDLDGRNDLFVINGSTFQERDAPERLVSMPDLLYWNGGEDRGFFGLAAGAFEEEAVGRGAALADYDGDGDLDLVAVDHSGPARLLRNDSRTENAWIRVVLEGPPGNTAGLGAAVEVFSGSRTMLRQVGGQSSYLSQNDPAQIFGLGSALKVDSVAVTWVTGQRSVYADVLARTTLVVPFGNRRQQVVDFWATFRAATRHRMEGRTKEAASAYRAALVSRPDHEDALYYLGAMDYTQGNEQEADSAWARLARINPKVPRSFMQLGSLRLCRPESPYFDPESARNYFETAQALNKATTGPLLKLGFAALALGEKDDAEGWFDAVLRSDPGNETAAAWSGWIKGDVTPVRGSQNPSAESGLGEGDTQSGDAMTAGEGTCPPFDLTPSDLGADPARLAEILSGRIASLRGPRG